MAHGEKTTKIIKGILSKLGSIKHTKNLEDRRKIKTGDMMKNTSERKLAVKHSPSMKFESYLMPGSMSGSGKDEKRFHTVPRRRSK